VAPLTVADVQPKLLTQADLPGSASFDAQDIGACLSYTRPSTNFPSAKAEFGQPATQAASEDVTQVVDIFPDPASASAYAAVLGAAAKACKPQDSRAAGNRTVSDTVATTTAAIGVWSGTRTTKSVQITPASKVPKAADYVYLLGHGVLVAELDVSFNNVDPSPDYQAQADQLVQKLLSRLP